MVEKEPFGNRVEKMWRKGLGVEGVCEGGGGSTSACSCEDAGKLGVGR